MINQRKLDELEVEIVSKIMANRDFGVVVYLDLRDRLDRMEKKLDQIMEERIE